MEVAPLADKPMVVRIGAAMQVDPAVFRDAQLPGARHAGEDQRRALVDVGVGAHQPGVGVGDEGVAGARCGDLLGAVTRAPVGQWVGRGHRREACQQRADGLLMLGQATAQMPTDGVLEHRVHRDRRARTVQVFHLRPAASGHAPGLEAAAGGFRPVQRDVGALGGLLRGQRLGAHHQRRADLATRHRLTQPVDAPLRHVAAGVGVDQLARAGAQAMGQRARRVGIAPERAGKARRGVGEQPDHRDAVQRLQQPCAGAAVVGGQPRGLGHQVQRRQRGARIALTLGDLAAADQDGGALVADRAAGAAHAQRPVQRGARFSMKARGPSLKSSLAITTACALADRPCSSASVRSSALLATPRLWRTATGALTVMRADSALAAASSPSRSASTLIMPSCSARSAGMGSPVRIISSATAWGRARGSRYRPPAEATRPRLTSGSPKRACGTATRRSQASAISQPPASAGPLIAAIQGLLRGECTKQAKLPRPVDTAFRSAPALKASLPAPVRITTHTSSSASVSSMAACSPRATSPLAAFRASGRLMVTRATWSGRRSIRTAGAVVSVMVGLGLRLWWSLWLGAGWTIVVSAVARAHRRIGRARPPAAAQRAVQNRSMDDEIPADLHLLVARAERGDVGATDLLFTQLYQQLHRLARREAQRLGPQAALGATTLLHEAYLDISRRDALAFPSQGHFMAYAARAMRGLVIDRVRERQAQKRGGGLHITSLDTELAESCPQPELLGGIGDALDELAQMEPALAQVVDLKFFCGFSMAEIAALTGSSERSVQR